jgi:hypothetical protein
MQSTPERTLTHILTPSRSGSGDSREGRFEIDIPDGWQQGRGAFGGLVLGALANAVIASEPDPQRKLRTLTGEIPSPVPIGKSTIVVEEVRRGSGASTWHARLLGDDGILALATVVLGKSRVQDPPRATSTMPDVPPWKEVPAIPIGPPLAPVFTQHLEMRPTGPLPFAGGDKPLSAGYVRTKIPPKKLGPAEILAYCDAHWPAFFATASEPRPVGTIAFGLQIVVDPDTLDPEQPLFHTARELACHEGFSAELRELYAPDGRLVAVNPQTFAIIR